MQNYILTLLAAVPILLLGIGMFAFNFFSLRRFNKTTGTVVGFAGHSDSEGISYAEIVDFKLPSGETIRFTDPVESGLRSTKKGQTVPVAYDPDQPKRARINFFFRVHFWATILVFIGLALMIISLALVIFSLFQSH